MRYIHHAWALKVPKRDCAWICNFIRLKTPDGLQAMTFKWICAAAKLLRAVIPKFCFIIRFQTRSKTVARCAASRWGLILLCAPPCVRLPQAVCVLLFILVMLIQMLQSSRLWRWDISCNYCIRDNHGIYGYMNIWFGWMRNKSCYITILFKFKCFVWGCNAENFAEHLSVFWQKL